MQCVRWVRWVRCVQSLWSSDHSNAPAAQMLPKYRKVCKHRPLKAVHDGAARVSAEKGQW